MSATLMSRWLKRATNEEAAPAPTPRLKAPEPSKPKEEPVTTKPESPSGELKNISPRRSSRQAKKEASPPELDAHPESSRPSKRPRTSARPSPSPAPQPASTPKRNDPPAAQKEPESVEAQPTQPKFESAFKRLMNKQLAELEEDEGDGDEDEVADDRMAESEYERERKKNIEANNQILAELGLVGTIVATVAAPEIVKKPQKRPPKVRTPKPAADIGEFVERRRSARLTKKDDNGDAAQEVPGETLGSVYNGNPAPSWEPKLEFGKAISGVNGGTTKFMLKHHSEFLDDPRSLMFYGHAHNCYSMDFNSNKSLLAVAGSGGFVSLFTTKRLLNNPQAGSNKENELGGNPTEKDLGAGEEDDNDADLQPLVSASIHRRWASGVQLLETPASDPEEPFVLSSSDDAHMILCKVTKGKEKFSMIPVAKIGPEIHTGGIFGMDTVGHQQEFSVVTGSKDTTISVTRISGERLSAVQTFRDFSDHPSVVKTVRWNCFDHQTFASGGNDQAVRIFDLRSGKQEIFFDFLHTMAVNTVDYNPGIEHQILSTGFDQVIQVLDLRQPTKPLFTLKSHHIKGRAKATLTSPIFYKQGAAIATIGDNTTNLYRYSTSTGALENVVDIGFTPTALLSYNNEDVMLAANGKSSIWAFQQGI